MPFGSVEESKQNVFSTNNTRALITTTFLTELSLQCRPCIKGENNLSNPNALIYIYEADIDTTFLSMWITFQKTMPGFPARSCNIYFFTKAALQFVPSPSIIRCSIPHPTQRPSNPIPSHPIQPLMAPRRYVHLWHVIFFFFWLRALINWILYFCALSNYCLSHFFPAAFSFDCWVRAPRPPQSLDFELCLICILICQNSPWVSAWLARNFYLLGSPFQHPVCSISGFKSIMNSVHMYADK